MSIAEKLTAVAENVPKVYEAGKKAEYDAFWDVFQQYGTRRKYDTAFYNPHHGWDGTTFNPKYDIICEGSATQMFYAWENLNTNADIGAILERNGVTLDTSKATNLLNFMAYGKSIVGTLPTISCESAKANTKAMFRNVQVTKIEMLIVTELTDFTDMFLYCSNLQEIRFRGSIATGALNMTSCKNLSADSLQSIIEALSDGASGKAITLPTTAQSIYDAKYGEHSWAFLISTKPNWTIAYA